MPIDDDSIDEPKGTESEKETNDDVREGRFKYQHDVTHNHGGDDLGGKVSAIEDA